MSADWTYMTVTQLLRQLKTGEISSRALLEHYIARLEEKNKAINAVVEMDFATARKLADEADAKFKAGVSLGPLHGLPMTVKDTYEVPGMTCVAGAPEYRYHRPKQAAVAVQRLQDAGAIIFGKTNVPYLASDLQSFNKVFGTTNNPWNTTLTPGGSSGGSAAALAAGITPAELGSDLAGSIRTPCHYCGVYGHKPTPGIISLRGHLPGPPGTLREPTSMAVAGPMARSAQDLELLLEVLVAPPPQLADGWKIDLPNCSKHSLADFKVLLWMDDDLCPIDPQLQYVYLEVADKLKTAGATVDRGQPAGFCLEDIYPFYVSQLGAVAGVSQPAMVRRSMALLGWLTRMLETFIQVPKHFSRFLKGMDMSFADYQRRDERVQHIRQNFLSVFDDYDLVLMPPTPSTAHPHEQLANLAKRKIPIGHEQRSYMDLFMWVAPVSLLGLAATSAPVGMTASNLPANLQIVAAPFQDKMALRFADLMSVSFGGFQPPPGY